MKAKELAALLLQHPEAEVICEKYTGVEPLMSVTDIKTYNKNAPVHDFNHSATDMVSSKGYCKTTVIILKTEQ